MGKRIGRWLTIERRYSSMLTPGDQLACLECIRAHLDPGGALVAHLGHQNVSWLNDLRGAQQGFFESGGEATHPRTGHALRSAHAWTYAPATQTASVASRWEKPNDDEQVLQPREREPMRLHSAFRFEMEHLLARAGYEEAVVYGDFYRGELIDQSSEMVWVAKRA